jgi:hypothetical protein
VKLSSWSCEWLTFTNPDRKTHAVEASNHWEVAGGAVRLERSGRQRRFDRVFGTRRQLRPAGSGSTESAAKPVEPIPHGTRTFERDARQVVMMALR